MFGISSLFSRRTGSPQGPSIAAFGEPLCLEHPQKPLCLTSDNNGVIIGGVPSRETASWSRTLKCERQHVEFFELFNRKDDSRCYFVVNSIDRSVQKIDPNSSINYSQAPLNVDVHVYYDWTLRTLVASHRDGLAVLSPFDPSNQIDLHRRLDDEPSARIKELRTRSELRQVTEDLELLPACVHSRDWSSQCFAFSRKASGERCYLVHAPTNETFGPFINVCSFVANVGSYGATATWGQEESGKWRVWVCHGNGQQFEAFDLIDPRLEAQGFSRRLPLSGGRAVLRPECDGIGWARLEDDRVGPIFPLWRNVLLPHSYDVTAQAQVLRENTFEVRSIIEILKKPFDEKRDRESTLIAADRLNDIGCPSWSFCLRHGLATRARMNFYSPELQAEASIRTRELDALFRESVPVFVDKDGAKYRGEFWGIPIFSEG